MEQGPFALVATWKEGATPEEVATAEEYIKGIMAQLEEATAEDMPSALEAITVKRLHEGE